MQFELQYFLYIPNLDEPIIDEDCAEIYESCNYGGDSLTICTRENNIPKVGWNKPVTHLLKFKILGEINPSAKG